MRLCWTGHAPLVYNNTIMATNYYIAKVYRQHNSLVLTIPQPVVITLGIVKGSHVVFKWNQQDCKFDFAKFKPEGAQDVRSSGSGDSKDTGG